MKRRIETYTFNATAKTVAFPGETAFSIDGLLAIIDVTEGRTLYLAGDGDYGYASVAGSTVTLSASTTGLADADRLLVLYEDGTATPVTDAAALAALLALPRTNVMQDEYLAETGTFGNPLEVSGDLVVMPFRNGALLGAAAGAAGAVATANSGFAYNDQWQTGLFLSCPANVAYGNSQIVQLVVWGNTFGLSLDRAGGYGGKIGCTINGEAYTVDNSAILNSITRVAFSAPAGPNIQILARDLGYGPHFVELVMPCQLTVANLVGIQGYVVERRAGYVAPPRGTSLVVAPAVLVANTWTTRSMQPSASGVYGTRKVIFANNTGGPAVVDVRYSSANASGVPIWTKTLADKDSAEFDLGGPFYSGYEVRSTVSGVTVMAIGQL